MGIRVGRGGLAVFLAAAAWLLGQAGGADAHPLLIGQWHATSPKAGAVMYDFGPGEYLGNGVWHGPLKLFMQGHLFATGTYELRMFTGAEGAIGLRENVGITMTCGTVDLESQLITY